MIHDPYRSRHSVWVEVFAVVFVGALVVGGGAYLLLQVDTSPSGLAASASQGGGAAPAAQRPSATRAAARSRGRSPRSGPSSPLLGGQSGTDPSGADPSGATAPFSESWRSEAVPSLSGSPSGGGGALGGGSAGAAGGAAPAPEGPAVASSRSFGTSGSGGSAHESRSGSGWRAEARRLSGRARALSGALRQLDRGGSGGGPASRSSAASSAERTASGGGPATSDRDTPDPPNPVPIEDHLPWLAALGLLWGAWRLHRGG